MGKISPGYLLVFWRVVFPLEVSGAGSLNQWEPVEIEDESMAGFAMAGSLMARVLELLELQWALMVIEERAAATRRIGLKS